MGIMKVFLQASAFTMSAKEIESIIPVNELAEIKSTDPNPFFQVYSICHEGTSQPRIIGDNAQPITWGRRAIQSIKSVIRSGVKFFKGHNSDSSHNGRRELGRTVASIEKEIDGKLHHLAVGYFPPETREEAKQYDVCSQESEWNLFEAAGGLIADTMDKITGIALGNSTEEKPAFSGAKRLGTLQAFSDVIESELNTKSRDRRGAEKMNFEDVKRFVADQNVRPWQLFKTVDILNDREFGPIFKAGQNIEKVLSEKEKEFADKLKENENKILELSKENQKTTAAARLQTIVKSNAAITEKQKEFIDKKFTGAELDDMSDEGLTTFVNAAVNDYNTFAGFFGGTPADPVNDPAGDGNAPGTNPTDFSKAENNELLEEDL